MVSRVQTFAQVHCKRLSTFRWGLWFCELLAFRARWQVVVNTSFSVRDSQYLYCRKAEQIKPDGSETQQADSTRKKWNLAGERHPRWLLFWRNFSLVKSGHIFLPMVLSASNPSGALASFVFSTFHQVMPAKIPAIPISPFTPKLACSLTRNITSHSNTVRRPWLIS